MTVVANIDEAIDRVVENVQANNATLLTEMQAWIQGMFVNPALFPTPSNAWDEESADQRTVRDWVHPSLVVQQAYVGVVGFPVAGSIVDQNNTMDVLERTLKAVKFSKIQSRVTQAQEDDTVTLYNAIWG
jgi:hypothetical protein